MGELQHNQHFLRSRPYAAYSIFTPLLTEIIMFFTIPCSAIKRIIYKKSDPILRERCRKTQKSMKWVIVSNGACGQYNEVFFISYERSFTLVCVRTRSSH